jgi:hypothetical protein
LIVETNSHEVHQIFIKLDHQCILVPSTNIIHAIDILFKLHWIFNINYAIQLENLMYFFEYIFKLNKENKNSVNEIYKLICKV